MAQNGPNHGNLEYLYLVDAQTARQYVLPYNENGFVKPFKVFSASGHEVEFQAGESIYAVDDQVKITYNDKGVPTFTADIYSLNVRGKDGELFFDMKRVPEAEFKTSFRVLGNRIEAIIAPTNETREELEQENVVGFPTNFIYPFKANDERITIEGNNFRYVRDVMQEIRIPPQHGGGALIARTAMAMAPQQKAIDTSLNGQFQTPSRKNAAAEKARQASLRPTESGFDYSDSDIENVIRKYCTDLTEKARKGKLDPVYGRDQDVEDSLTIMLRREQASLCYTGEAGVGKSAMFAAVAQRLAGNDNLPESLKNARVLELDLTGMNAGAMYRGQFEQRLKPLIDGLKEREGWFKGRKIFLAIDEIHSQLTAGKAEGGTDAGNIMKPFMAAKGISVLGTTTTDEYRKHIEKDPALARRFEEKVLSEPSETDTFKILKHAVWPIMSEHHGLTEDMSDEDFQYIVTMSNRYAPNEAQPAKGKKVIDMAAAGAQKRGSGVINRNDIIKAISQMSKLPEDFLNKKDYDRLKTLDSELAEAVLGQDKALRQLTDTLTAALAGLKDPNKPLGTFFMQGPPGTGKTETAKALARILFGSEDALIKLDMSEYAEKHEVAKLTGAPPGYVGYEDGKPALTDRIRSRPYSVLLFDEAEKAHPDVWNVLLAPINDGEMKDNKGKTASFRNVLMLFTSNLGAKEAQAALEMGGTSLDFAIASKAQALTGDKSEEILSSVYAAAVKKHFKPEFIDRIEENGGFVTFRPLGAETINKLTTRALHELDVRLSDRSGANLEGVKVEFSNDIMAQLAKEGYVPDAGARPLKGLIRKKITNPLAVWLLQNKEALISFAQENGGARLVIDSLENFTPKIEPLEPKAPLAIATNDNVESVQAVKKPRNRKPGPQGPV